MDRMPYHYLEEPEHSQYSEASSIQGNFLYPGYSSSGANSDVLLAVGNAKLPHSTLALPAVTAMISHAPSLSDPNVIASGIGERAQESWKDGKNQMLLMQALGLSIGGGTGDLLHGDGDGDGDDLQANVSLSLGARVAFPYLQHHSTSPGTRPPPQITRENDGSCRDQNNEDSSVSLAGSRYLKLAQELLDEVVGVQKALKQQKSDKSRSHPTAIASSTTGKDGNWGSRGRRGMPLEQQDSIVDSSTALSPSERQDLQNKVTRLVAMLEEVDRRYKQYLQQTQLVVTSLDAIAGSGAAKPYTALALQTISRHFRCLRDAIGGQIRATRRSLGEQDNSGGRNGGISRLRYIDQRLRQQRTLQQQFGMMQQQQHAWRPQRGLPESSVSILRAWLFEHFLHPYPSDSEKLMLARETGLTRGQVSNWFINARVRLWKPMIEDIYREEMGDAEINSNSSSENPHRGPDDLQSSEDQGDVKNQFAGDSSAASFHSEFREALVDADGSGRFMAAYRMAVLGGGGGGVSLTLGLQHCDGSLAAASNQQGIVGLQGDGDVYAAAAPVIGADAADYDFPHRFGSSQHLVHDFAA